jgi:hypothetical protein
MSFDTKNRLLSPVLGGDVDLSQKPPFLGLFEICLFLGDRYDQK